MRKIATTSITGVALLIATPALAQQKYPGLYLGLGVGGQYLESLSGPFGRGTDLNYDWGPMGTGNVGYAFGNGFRAEFEFGYRHSDAKNITLPSGATTPTSLNLKSNVNAYTYMVNGLYDFLQLNWPVIPHLGVGLGVADVRVNNLGKDSPFAYQFIAGADYPIKPNLAVGLDYRFLGTDSLNLRNTGGFPNVEHPNYYDHAILLHVTYSFGGPKSSPPQAQSSTYTPPPPPPPPPAAQGQAAPPTPQAFTVLFGLNSATLDASARQTVDQAAQTAKSGGTAHLNVVGHTDTSGSASHNQALSQRRAAAVRAELMRSGVRSDEITTSGVGESDLAVPTGNNVREAQNRRVVIEVQRPGV